MPIYGLDTEATREFVSKHDSKDPHEQTIFVLRTLDSRILSYLRDLSTQTTMKAGRTDKDADVDVRVLAGEVYFQACQLGLAGIRGRGLVNEATGLPYEFELVQSTVAGARYSVADPKFVRRIPRAIVWEIGLELLKAHEISDDEGNESGESPSPQSSSQTDNAEVAPVGISGDGDATGEQPST